MLTRSGASKRRAEDAGLTQGSKADAKFPSKLKDIKTPEFAVSVPQESPKRNFNDFSADVLLMIFKYLDTVDIALSVQPVCKTWYAVGQSPILWKKIKMDCELSTWRENSLIAVIHRARLLKSLILSESDDVWEVSNILECVAKNCPLLSTLHLSSCEVNSDAAVQLLVSSCPCLKRLRLESVSGSALKEFAELTTLMELEIIHSSDLQDFFPRLSQNSRQLETVMLEDSEFCTDEQLVPLLTNLKSVLKTFQFMMHGCRSPILRVVAECSNLQSIGLFILDDYDTPDLKALEKLKKLERIHIKQFTIPDLACDAWKSFMLNVGSDHIESVSFYYCKNISGLLEEVLSTRDDTILHRANTLELRSNGDISDRAVELILKGNPFLKTLRLYKSLGFQGLAFNTSDTRVAPALRCLNVGNCDQVRLSYLRTFLKSRPGLKIIGPNEIELKL